MMEKILITLALVLSFVALKAQETIVHGRLTAFGELPVSNFPVKAKKSKITTMTNAAGYFTINCADGEVLIFKGLPFMTQRVFVEKGDSVKVNMILLEGDQNAQKAIEKGYMKDADVTRGRNELSDYNNNFHTYRDIYQLIEGKFSNVEVNDAGQIFIRGRVQSLTLDASALLIVNGIETTDISYIRPENVAS